MIYARTLLQLMRLKKQWRNKSRKLSPERQQQAKEMIARIDREIQARQSIGVQSSLPKKRQGELGLCPKWGESREDYLQRVYPEGVKAVIVEPPNAETMRMLEDIRRTPEMLIVENREEVAK